jgi:hypothetical protein
VSFSSVSLLALDLFDREGGRTAVHARYPLRDDAVATWNRLFACRKTADRFQQDSQLVGGQLSCAVDQLLHSSADFGRHPQRVETGGRPSQSIVSRRKLIGLAGLPIPPPAVSSFVCRIPAMLR